MKKRATRQRVIDKIGRRLQLLTILRVEQSDQSCLPQEILNRLFKGEFSMRWILVTAVLPLTLTSVALGQEQSSSRDQRSSVEQAIRQLDRERIQAQIGADAVPLSVSTLMILSA